MLSPLKFAAILVVGLFYLAQSVQAKPRGASPAALMQLRNELQQLEYEITSAGENIGEMTLSIIQRGRELAIIEESNIDIVSWWGDLSWSTSIYEWYEGYALVLSCSLTLNDNSAYWTQVAKNNEGYDLSFRQIDKLDKDIVDRLTNGLPVTSHQKSTLSKSICDNLRAVFKQHKTNAYGIVLEPGSFHTTSNLLPLLIAGQKLAGPHEFRVLDTENLTLTEVIARKIPAKKNNSDDSLSPEPVLESRWNLAGENYRAELWLPQQQQIPYFIKLNGEDEDGKFEIKLKAAY